MLATACWLFNLRCTCWEWREEEFTSISASLSLYFQAKEFGELEHLSNDQEEKFINYMAGACDFIFCFPF